MSQNEINPDDPAYMIVTCDGKEPTTFSLERNASVFVGSGSNCRLVLPSDNVKQIHCMLLLEDSKRLKVQDWNTGETILNGVPVVEDAIAKSGDIVCLAEYKLIPVLDREFHLGIASELLSGESSLPAVAVTSVETPIDNRLSDLSQRESDEDYFDGSIDELISQATDEEEIATNISEQNTANDEWTDAEESSSVASNEMTEMSDQEAGLTESDWGAVDDSTAGPRVQTGGFVYDIDADLKEGVEEEPTSEIDFAIDFNSDFEDEIEAQEATEMLQMEVEQLRFELAERDSKIAALQDAQNQPADSIDDDQTIKLVNRLEELLEELQASDDRTRNLEELLRLSDEANQAENEERIQLETWVGEIESRVAQRESEYQAEIDRLSQRFQESKTQLENAEVQFKKLLKTQGDQGDGAEMSAQSKELIEECRQQIQQLRQQLEAVTEENAALRVAAEAGAEDVDVRQQLKETQEKLVALQVESSRERAEMARRHAELERIRDELEERLNSAKAIASDDSKIAAMRQHLREIHEQEKIEKEETRQKSLSGRIANLLTRLR